MHRGCRSLAKCAVASRPMSVYHFQEQEQRWSQTILFGHYSDRDQSQQPKKFVLPMFPYSSGSLHMGHVRVYTLSDAISRFYRTNHYNVKHPIGWDSFGLPAENAAIKKGVDPAEWTAKNISDMRSQLFSLGFSFDYDREVATSSPNYHFWTQWLFLKLRSSGLAYRKEGFVNWDPVDCTALADEQVDEQGRSWRSGAIVEKRKMEQWYFRITKYADRLLSGLPKVSLAPPTQLQLSEWPDVVKGIQRGWIGKTEGLQVQFPTAYNRPLSLFVEKWRDLPAINAVVINACHPSLDSILASNPAISNFQKWGKRRDTLSLGPILRNPVTQLPISVTLSHEIPDLLLTPSTPAPASEASSMDFSLRDSLVHNGVASVLTQFHLRDWSVSRQRKWGTPIPVGYCDQCGEQPVPRRTLGDRNSALCPCCHKEIPLDPHTLDTFVDSSWYYLRYTSPHDSTAAFSSSVANEWGPVGIYLGGIEHAAQHLIYARFINQFLHDEGLISFDEPFQSLITPGVVKALSFRSPTTGEYFSREEATGKQTVQEMEKMSKSKLNGVNPQEVTSQYGADATRLAILFAAPIDRPLEWDQRLLTTQTKFLQRVLDLLESIPKPSEVPAPVAKSLEVPLRELVEGATKDYQTASLHTVVSSLMKFTNLLAETPSPERGAPLFRKACLTVLQLLFPLAPFSSFDWGHRFFQTDVSRLEWPSASDLASRETRLIVQVDGKMKGSKSTRAMETLMADCAEFVGESDQYQGPVVVFKNNNVIVNFRSRK